jgi:hypothetical protein
MKARNSTQHQRVPALQPRSRIRRQSDLYRSSYMVGQQVQRPLCDRITGRVAGGGWEDLRAFNGSYFINNSFWLY